MKKRIISALMAVALTVGTCSVAMAADTAGATSDSLKSHGTIVYENADETVVINSLDLYMLADQIDQIRVNVTKQLGNLHTYFTTGQGAPLQTDGRLSVTHTTPAGGNYVDPLTIDFDTLLEGIAASQWIPSDVKDYGYAAGTRLYQKADGSLTTDKGTESLPEIHIREATADNLSAGTAAWVNGRLLLGTGQDNRSYMEKGQDAASENNTSSTDGIFQDFITVGGYMGDFDGVLPYTFTPGKSLLMVFDGPLKATFDGSNLPDTAVTGRYFSMYHWKSNPHTSINVKVNGSNAGYNATLLVKEW